MLTPPKIQKKKLHPRNKHIEGYDFDKLIVSSPELKKFITINPVGNRSINFADPLAVKPLNTALLKTYYSINFWDIPGNNLCPPIPGRADYIHYIADVLAENYEGNIPHGPKIKILDIGVGANCIYPIIGSHEYGWSFVGTDSSKQAVKNAREVVERNQSLKNLVSIRFQPDTAQIFKDCLLAGEFYHFVICNPPFFSSASEAASKTVKKLKNLGKDKNPSLVQNFGGKDNELWTPGGERSFVSKMMLESQVYQKQCLWFSSLISQKENIKPLTALLQKLQVKEHRIIPMEQGNKISRILVWRF